ncbi:PRC-barrel domain-containing protein [Pseudorhizobium flavum]|uniref:Sporulation protein YlmC with PRC-barrel domain n=1 Tax=Pseudorhizobium flavum TaxID=1335061 RepID=A0A7W9YZ62_9HYPH|nr:PRC-barrel domain-containing protein [Pseudorhizobium flavum]MBB6180301.1 sporulation protein YlmC with PRC-barrel domain [Pseudorhizobium flavum]CAD6620085.1 photosystem reaction center subunit H [Pseudorhizobium flavum]
MRKMETALALVLASSITPVAAQGAGDASSSGADQVRKLGDHAFSQWDSNSNDRLEDGEFTSGLHDAWSGSNGELGEQAFTENWNNWFSAAPPSFASLDEDEDGALSNEELQIALSNADLTGEWQGAEDGYLTPEEFRSGLTAVNDRDRSGTLDEQESEQLVAIVSVVVPDEEKTASTNAEKPGNAGTGGAGVKVGKVIPLSEWNPDELYRTAWSAEALFDRPVYGAGDERIGDVEDLIIGPDGKLLSVVAEVGGLWDIGDTHVSVPWEEVTVRVDGSIAIPVTEENADDYGVLRGSETNFGNRIVSDLDNEELGPRAWRASELIGDIARVRDGGSQAEGTYRGYGYVEDLIFNDGKVTAAVVDRDPAGPDGRGAVAYPFYGYGYGWTPGNPYYDLPYDRGEVSTLEPFDRNRLNEG